MSDWQWQQQMDEAALQQAVLDALREAKKLGLPEEQIMTLGYAAGMADDVYKEIRK